MVEWRIDYNPVDYSTAVLDMERRVAGIRSESPEDRADELVWLLEHPPLYTAGTSAKAKDLLNPLFPIYKSGRGGEYTYHGPGQRIAYVMLDLKKRNPDIRAYIYKLEEWIIAALKDFGVNGERREGRVGIWVDMQDYGGKKGDESKIAAIGVRLRKWVTYHGIAINLNPDLSHFSGIVPCGISDYGVTSLHALGKTKITTGDVDAALRKNFPKVFG